MTCGDRIKIERKKNKLSQTELGNLVGLKFSTISKYEQDKISIPSDNLKKIAYVLSVSTDYLLGNTSIVNPKQHLEEVLSKYKLSEKEYDLVLSSFIIERKIDLTILNSVETLGNVSKAYHEIFDVYLDYLKAYPLDENITDFDEAKKMTEPIDNNFIEMLKGLNKYKIIYTEPSNVFPTIDTPKQYPVLGKISAGLPILAVENIEGYSIAPSSKIQEGYDYFFLKVQGDSMNLKFPDGCLLLVQKQETIENSQIGVFRINGDDATVKRFKEENGLVILEPMSNNPIHQVQIYNPQDITIEIIGKVVSFMGDVN